MDREQMIQKPDRKEGCKTSTMTERNITTEETSSAFVASPEPLYGSFVFGVALTFATSVLLAMDRIRQLNLFDSLAPALALLNAVVVLIILRGTLLTLVSVNTAAAAILSLVLVLVLGRALKRQQQPRPTQPNIHLLKKMLAYG